MILIWVILSIILETVLRKVMGLYQAISVWGLFGFKIVIILPFFPYVWDGAICVGIVGYFG